MIQFVFDTNTIVSALLFDDSVPRQAFDQALHNRPAGRKPVSWHQDPDTSQIPPLNRDYC